MNKIIKTKPQPMDKYPFLSYVTYGGEGYLGVIQNYNSTITSIYHFDALITKEEKRIFLKLGDEWWWQSNRMIPINVFLKGDWKQFRYSLLIFNSKDVELEFGPYVNLGEIAYKRSKRRSITLVRKVE